MLKAKLGILVGVIQNRCLESRNHLLVASCCRIHLYSHILWLKRNLWNNFTLNKADIKQIRFIFKNIVSLKCIVHKESVVTHPFHHYLLKISNLSNIQNGSNAEYLLYSFFISAWNNVVNCSPPQFAGSNPNASSARFWHNDSAISMYLKYSYDHDSMRDKTKQKSYYVIIA